MKIEIYNDDKKKDEDVLRLKARIDCCGDFVVYAVDSGGSRVTNGHILAISSDGKLIRNSCCFVKGIKADNKGRIELDE